MQLISKMISFCGHGSHVSFKIAQRKITEGLSGKMAQREAKLLCFKLRLSFNTRAPHWSNEYILLCHILGRMRTPVREALSYEIQHGIWHIHCDSMKYDLMLYWITMNMPYPVPYAVWKCLPYGSTHPPYCSWQHCIFCIKTGYL